MGYALFKFTNCPDADWTPFIQMSTWKVSSKPRYETWTDGNGREHRDTYDYKISGTFTMIIDDSAMYSSFLDRIEAERLSSGYTPIIVYDNLRQYPVAINAYIDLDPKNEIPYMDGKGKCTGFEVTIEEF